MILRERILILRTFKFSESDLIVHGLSRLGQKKNFIAKAALKSRRRFGGGVLEPSHYLEVQYQKARREGGLHTLLEAELLEGFAGLRDNFARLKTAFYFLKLVNQVAQEGEIENKGLFDLLGNGLKACESRRDLTVLTLQFEARLLRQQGVLAMDNRELEQIIEVSILEDLNSDVRFTELALLLRGQIQDHVGLKG